MSRRIALAALLFASTTALAEDETVVLAHAGRLLTANDAPADGPVKMRFGLYKKHEPDGVDDPSWWVGTEVDVQVRQGLYTIDIGSPASGTGALPASAFEGAGERWFGVSVAGVVLTPRLRVGRVPLAVQAVRALRADAATAADSATTAASADALSSACEGCVTKSHIASIEAGQITGLIQNEQLAPIATAMLNGLVTNEQVKTLSAEKITSTLQASQIESIGAAQVTGQLVDEQLAGISATKIIGQLQDAQLAGIGAGKVTGQLTDAQLAGIAGSKVTGPLANAQIAAENVTGTLALGQLPSIPYSKLTGIPTFALLDAAPGSPAMGAVYWNTAKSELHLWDGAQWLPIATPKRCGANQPFAGRSCNTIKQECPSSPSGKYWITGARTTPFEVYCDMTNDNGGWTLVWKHSYLEVGQPTDQMRWYTQHDRPCIDLTAGWCNVSGKLGIGTQHQTTEARFNGTLVYRYRGDLNSKLETAWDGGILNNYVKVVDLCNSSNGVPPEPTSTAAGAGFPGITLDKANLGNYVSNCDTNWSNGGLNGTQTECRWENCSLPSSISSSVNHVQMTAFMYVR